MLTLAVALIVALFAGVIVLLRTTMRREAERAADRMFRFAAEDALTPLGEIGAAPEQGEHVTCRERCTVVALLPDAGQSAGLAREFRRLFRDVATWRDVPSGIFRFLAPGRLRALRMSPAEWAFFRRHGLPPPASGFRWTGTRAEAPRSARSVGRVLILGRLPDPSRGAASPAAILTARGAKLLLEGDGDGEGAVTLDLSCVAADSATAKQVHDALADYFAAYPGLLLRPPWQPGTTLSPPEISARRTFRMCLEGLGRRWPAGEPEPDPEVWSFLEVNNCFS